jgi:DNA-binding transcriptional regulator LsrR (DeoR family)
MRKSNRNAAKLSLNSIEEIKNQYRNSDITMDDLSKKYNVTTTTIWRHLKNIDSDNKKRGAGAVSKYCNLTKINEDIAKRILILYMSGQMTQKMIAEMYDLHQTTVHYICTGKSWKHLFQDVRSSYNKEILSVLSTK